MKLKAKVVFGVAMLALCFAGGSLQKAQARPIEVGLVSVNGNNGGGVVPFDGNDRIHNGLRAIEERRGDLVH